MPYGGNQRYDLVIEDANEHFWRLQCKSAWIDEDGAMLKFDTANHNVTGKRENGGTIEDNATTLPFIVHSLVRSTWFQLMM